MGAWFLGTFLFSIPAYFFFEPLLNDPDYMAEGGSASRIGIGSLLEILLAVCGIATAVVIHPIVQRVNRSVALGYIAARTVESDPHPRRGPEPDGGRGTAPGPRRHR